MKRLLLVCALAGCTAGKSTLAVHVTSDGMIGGIDHFELTVVEQVTPPHSVGPIHVSSGATIPPAQSFALVFDRDVHATVALTLAAVDGGGATLASAGGSVAIVPGKQADVTITLPSAGGGDMSVGGADLAGSGGPDLMPPPGCPIAGDGGAVAAGDPCTAGTAPRECYGGPSGTCGVGTCRPGVRYCLDGAWGPCVGEVDPQLEVCDGRDQDCNGIADDGLGTVSCGIGECAVTVAACTNGKPTVCTPKNGVAEICDGKDNDCNGAIDEIGCPCVHVAPNGNDANNGSAGSPLLTIGAAIALAGTAGHPKIVCVASGAGCPSAATYNEAVAMANGIHVYGGYESGGWTRAANCVVTVGPTSSAPGVGFDVNVTQQTIVDSFVVRGTPPVSIVGSKGAQVSNVTAGGGNGAAVEIKDFNGTAATPLITGSRFTGTVGVRSTRSKPTILHNCSSSRDAGGHCLAQAACAGPASPLSSSFYDTTCVELDSSPGAVVAENDMCGATGINITGDATGTLIRGNGITPYNNGPGYAINSSGCNYTSPWIFDNSELAGGVDNYMGNQPPSSFGVVAGGGCDLRIDHNVEITGLLVVGSQDATGVWCQRDPGTLRESRCQIVDNTIFAGKAAVAGTARAVRCDDLSCARIEGNVIKVGPGGANNYGVVLGRSGTLVARNTIDAGGVSTSTVTVGAAVDTTDAYARIENNLIRGASCGGQTFGVREHLLAGGNEVDLHSNVIHGGGVAAGCTSRAVSLDAGGTTPASARGLVRNNILQPGACASMGYDVYEATAMATPRLLANNDFAPAPFLYHSNAMGDLTLTQINALGGAAANVSGDPMLAADGIHETAASTVCIDKGTAAGAPPDDYDGKPRPVGSGFDIGADER